MKRSKRFLRWVYGISILLAVLAAVLTPALREAAADDDPLGGAREFLVSSNLVVIGVTGDTSAKMLFGQDDQGNAIDGEPLASPTLTILPNAPRKIYAHAAATGQMPGGEDAICAFYFAYDTNYDDETSDTYIYASLVGKGGGVGGTDALLPVPLGDDNYAPAYKLPGWDLADPLSDSYFPPSVIVGWDVSTTLEAEDWSGDGVSDYILTYRHYDIQDSYEYPVGYIYEATGFNHVFLYIDGQSLYDAVAAQDATKIKKVINIKEGPVNAKVQSPQIPISTRTATSDVDGDGSKDFIVAYRGINCNDVEPYYTLAAYSITADANGNAVFSQIDRDKKCGQLSNYINAGHIGLAAGDLDGDGKGEIYVVYQSGTIEGGFTHKSSMDQWIYENGKFVNTYDEGQFHYLENGDMGNVSLPIETAILDIDGDGKNELLLMNNTLTRVNSDLSTQQLFDLSSFLWRIYDNMDGMILSLSMTAGSFVAPSSSSTTQAFPQQVAIGVRTKRGTEDQTYTKWAVLGGGGTYLIGNDNHPHIGDITAVDGMSITLLSSNINGGGFVLGDPKPIQIESVTPLVIMQAPPRHRDIVSGDFSAGGAGANYPNPPDANGNSFPDAFSDLLNYETQYNSTTSDQSISTTTKSSSVKVGVDLETKTSLPVPLFSASVSAGVKYANTQAESHSDQTIYTTSTALASSAGVDDMIYANTTSYTVWRYPIISPPSAAVASADVVGGGESAGQAFIQLVSPTKKSTSLLPTPGRNFSWYEPDHDNFNLFTYPSDVKKTAGYPSATATVPWNSAGFELAYQAGLDIGAADNSSAQVSISSSGTSTDTSSVTNTLGVSVGVSAKIAAVGEYSLNATNDDVWKTDSVSTTNASTMKGVTLNWPGMTDAPTKPYVNKSNFRREDQEFQADVAIYTRADGTLNTSYAVSNLLNANSYLWGRTSPYSKLPDPGLLLPFRFTTDGNINTDDSSHTLRGLSLSNALFAGALPYHTPITGTFRVYNYSLVNMTGTITYEVRYQKTDNDGPYADGPDWSKATVAVASGNVPAIPGRQATPNDNWTDVTFQWASPPIDEESGYIHVRLTYAGQQQLNVDNDWGYYGVGFYNPNDFSGLPLSISAGSRQSVAARGTSDLDLRLEKVEISGVRGGVITDHNAIPQDEPIRLICTVALDGSVQAGSSKGAQVVFLDLYVNRTDDDHGSLVASKHVPYLPSGKMHTFTIDYDPTLHRDLVNLETLTVTVSSFPGLQISDANPENHVKVLRFADTSSNGGGCDATGFGLFAGLLLPVLTLTGKLLGGRKRK